MRRWRKVKAGRRDESAAGSGDVGGEIEFFDAGDYPLRLTEAHFDRMVDVYTDSIHPSCSLMRWRIYNFDHPNAAHFAQETGWSRRRWGTSPGAKYTYAAPPDIPVRAASARDVQFQAAGDPQHIDEVWDVKRKTFGSRGAKTFVGLL